MNVRSDEFSSNTRVDTIEDVISLSYCYESAGICRVSVMLQKIMFCKPGGARSRVL